MLHPAVPSNEVLHVKFSYLDFIIISTEQGVTKVLRSAKFGRRVSCELIFKYFLDSYAQASVTWYSLLLKTSRNGIDWGQFSNKNFFVVVPQWFESFQNQTFFGQKYNHEFEYFPNISERSDHVHIARINDIF